LSLTKSAQLDLRITVIPPSVICMVDSNGSLSDGR